MDNNNNNDNEKYVPLYEPSETSVDSGDNENIINNNESNSMQKQLDSMNNIKHFFSYPTYILSCQIRFAYFFFLDTALTFVMMMAFVFTIFFSVLLPESRTEEYWGYRAGFMLPMAPIMLIGGSWFCDELIDLIADALNGHMSSFRLRLLSFIHTIMNWSIINNNNSDDDDDSVQPNRWVLRIVDFICPFLMELFPVIGFIKGASNEKSTYAAVTGYFSWGLGVAAIIGLIYVIVHFLTAIPGKFRITFKYFKKTSPFFRSGFIVPIHYDINNDRPLNMGRWLCPQSYWEKRAQKSNNNNNNSYDNMNCCSKIIYSYKTKIKFVYRVLIDLLLFFGIAMLCAYNYIGFGLSWFLLCIIMYLIGLKLLERYPNILGSAFHAFLLFFTVFGGLLFIFAAANLEPKSTLNVHPPKVYNNLNFKSSSDINSNQYLICSKSWKGLSIVDLGILSNLAYCSSDDDFDMRMHNSFSNTTLSNYTVLHSEAGEEVIHFKHLYFADANINVIVVRGTSTAAEIYEDAYLYSGITIFQIVNLVAPIEELVPDLIIQRIMRALSLPKLAAAPSWQECDDYVKYLLRNGLSREEILITGHSLGGAVSGIVASRNSIIAVTFSPPGLYYQDKRISVTTEDLRRHITSIVPDHDVVPKVDKQYGNVQMIQCDKLAPQCHSIDTTLCTLKRICNDPRNRTNWESYCANH